MLFGFKVGDLEVVGTAHFQFLLHLGFCFKSGDVDQAGHAFFYAGQGAVPVEFYHHAFDDVAFVVFIFNFLPRVKLEGFQRQRNFAVYDIDDLGFHFFPPL